MENYYRPLQQTDCYQWIQGASQHERILMAHRPHNVVMQHPAYQQSYAYSSQFLSAANATPNWSAYHGSWLANRQLRNQSHSACCCPTITNQALQTSQTVENDVINTSKSPEILKQSVEATTKQHLTAETGQQNRKLHGSKDTTVPATPAMPETRTPLYGVVPSWWGDSDASTLKTVAADRSSGARRQQQIQQQQQKQQHKTLTETATATLKPQPTLNNCIQTTSFEDVIKLRAVITNDAPDKFSGQLYDNNGSLPQKLEQYTKKAADVCMTSSSNNAVSQRPAVAFTVSLDGSNVEFNHGLSHYLQLSKQRQARQRCAASDNSRQVTPRLRHHHLRDDGNDDAISEAGTYVIGSRRHSAVDLHLTTNFMEEVLDDVGGDDDDDNGDDDDVIAGSPPSTVIGGDHQMSDVEEAVVAPRIIIDSIDNNASDEHGASSCCEHEPMATIDAIVDVTVTNERDEQHQLQSSASPSLLTATPPQTTAIETILTVSQSNEEDVVENTLSITDDTSSKDDDVSVLRTAHRGDSVNDDIVRKQTQRRQVFKSLTDLVLTLYTANSGTDGSEKMSRDSWGHVVNQNGHSLGSDTARTGASSIDTNVLLERVDNELNAETARTYASIDTSLLLAGRVDSDAVYKRHSADLQTARSVSSVDCAPVVYDVDDAARMSSAYASRDFRYSADFENDVETARSETSSLDAAIALRDSTILHSPGGDTERSLAHTSRTIASIDTNVLLKSTDDVVAAAQVARGRHRKEESGLQYDLTTRFDDVMTAAVASGKPLTHKDVGKHPQNNAFETSLSTRMNTVSMAQDQVHNSSPPLPAWRSFSEVDVRQKTGSGFASSPQMTSSSVARGVTAMMATDPNVEIDSTTNSSLDVTPRNTTASHFYSNRYNISASSLRSRPDYRTKFAGELDSERSEVSLGQKIVAKSRDYQSSKTRNRGKHVAFSQNGGKPQHKTTASSADEWSASGLILEGSRVPTKQGLQSRTLLTSASSMSGHSRPVTSTTTTSEQFKSASDTRWRHQNGDIGQSTSTVRSDAWKEEPDGLSDISSITDRHQPMHVPAAGLRSSLNTVHANSTIDEQSVVDAALVSSISQLSTTVKLQADQLIKTLQRTMKISRNKFDNVKTPSGGMTARSELSRTQCELIDILDNLESMGHQLLVANRALATMSTTSRNGLKQNGNARVYR